MHLLYDVLYVLPPVHEGSHYLIASSITRAIYHRVELLLMATLLLLLWYDSSCSCVIRRCTTHCRRTVHSQHIVWPCLGAGAAPFLVGMGRQRLSRTLKAHSDFEGPALRPPNRYSSPPRSTFKTMTQNDGNSKYTIYDTSLAEIGRCVDSMLVDQAWSIRRPRRHDCSQVALRINEISR